MASAPFISAVIDAIAVIRASGISVIGRAHIVPAGSIGPGSGEKGQRGQTWLRGSELNITLQPGTGRC
jgi:hypothetical protein